MQIRTNVPLIIKVVMWVAAAMIIIVVFHLGGTIALRAGQFSPLTGAFIVEAGVGDAEGRGPLRAPFGLSVRSVSPKKCQSEGREDRYKIS